MDSMDPKSSRAYILELERSNAVLKGALEAATEQNNRLREERAGWRRVAPNAEAWVKLEAENERLQAERDAAMEQGALQAEAAMRDFEEMERLRRENERRHDYKVEAIRQTAGYKAEVERLTKLWHEAEERAADYYVENENLKQALS